MQTIGERLEDARKKKGISLREAAEATKIRSEYLQKFENNQFDFDLAGIYVRGFLRAYANYLKVPSDKIVNDYTALTASASRPRQPSREVYGRMDISVASSSLPANEASAAAAPDSSTAETPRRLPRPGNVSAGSRLDPAVVYRIAIGLIILVVLGLVAWGVTALVRGSSPAQAPATSRVQIAPAASASTEPTLTFIALDTVRIKVSVRNPDGTPDEVLLPDVTLSRGESRTVPKRGPLYLTATALENVAIEENGHRTNIRDQGLTGYNRVQIGR